MILNTVGLMLKVEAVLLLLPAIAALIYGESCLWPILISAAISLAAGFALTLLSKPKTQVIYARALQNSLGSNVETLYKLMDERVEALEFRVQTDFPMTNVPLKDMRLKSGILIAGIIRNRKTIIPSGVDVILPGDRVIVLSAASGMHDLSDVLKQ